jgi:2-dehydropantoate 2-reductase
MSDKKSRILVWGAGAIGGSVGAHLSRAGHAVTLVDVSTQHVAAIRERGLSIVGPISNFTINLPALTPGEVNGRWPLAMLAVKAQHTAAATEALTAHLDTAGAVLSLQNGLSAEMIAARVGRERTFLALGSVAADVLAPGEIRFGSSMKMPIGQLDGRDSGMLDEIVAIMRDFEPRAFGASDIQNYFWGKHCFNTITCASASALSPLADLAAREELRPLWGGLYREVLSVARAQGIEPRRFGPFDPMAFAPGASPQAAEAFLRILSAGSNDDTKPHSGMWRDLAIHRRQTEVASLLEPIIQLGARYDVKTPLLSGVVSMIGEIEQGRRAQNDANLLELLQRAEAPETGNGH